jgi:hypothetical protein
VNFWFAHRQQDQLRALARTLEQMRGPIADAMRVALSRTIITKSRGASLAIDVSHSRPHKVRESNDFDVFDGFLRAIQSIAPILDNVVAGRVVVRSGDARQLPRSLTGKVDLVVTSPPYLNAIDYMRGHRLSLVWLGYQVSDLRAIRSNSVGAERLPDASSEVARKLVPRHRNLSSNAQGMLDRYALDISALMSEIRRVLTGTGEAVIVVGDSTIKGTYIKNSKVVEKAGARAGLELIERRTRRLPPSSRYLPPPTGSEGPLSKRMRSEVVLRFQPGAVA